MNSLKFRHLKLIPLLSLCFSCLSKPLMAPWSTPLQQDKALAQALPAASLPRYRGLQPILASLWRMQHQSQDDLKGWLIGGVGRQAG